MVMFMDFFCILLFSQATKFGNGLQSLLILGVSCVMAVTQYDKL